MKASAGILMYRLTQAEPEVLLVHPGGPFFKNKDSGVWSIPKGEIAPGEQAKTTAIREFREELGYELEGDLIELTPVRQKGGKTVFAWAVEGDLDCENVTCNTFMMEWPPKSGKMQEFTEIDRAEWFSPDTARLKINAAQAALIDELLFILDQTK